MEIYEKDLWNGMHYCEVQWLVIGCDVIAMGGEKPSRVAY